MVTKRTKDETNIQPVSPTAKKVGETLTVPVVEERAAISKRIVETGKVRVSKTVAEQVELVDVSLLREEVSVERVPINQYVSEPPQVRYEGEVMIIPVVREEAVIQKRLVLVEELRVVKQVIETHQPQNITLRKETVNVKRITENEISND